MGFHLDIAKKAATCMLARLAVADTVTEIVRLEHFISEESNACSKPWRSDVEIARHLASAISNLIRIAEAFGLEPSEVVPQKTCGLCSRPCIEYRRENDGIVCVVCKNDDDFDARIVRVQRELTQLSIEHNAEDVGERILAGLGIGA